MTDNFCFIGIALASVHLEGLFADCEILTSNAALFLD
jgi:hypothetical protein